MQTNIYKNILIAAGLATTIGLTGCSKKFLDEPKSTSIVGPDDVFSSDAGVRSNFNGIYRNLRTQWGTSTDAWGIASVNLAREVKGVDITLPDQNWYSFDYQHDNREPTYRRVVFTWNFFFQLLNSANTLIAGVEASTTLSPTSKTAFIAEAKAIRAWCNLELVREFGHAYLENPATPGIPLYTIPTNVNTIGNPRAKVSEVYDLMISDLEAAVAGLGTARQLKDVINKNVANGLLARVYLEKGDYPKAKAAALAARTGLTLSVNGSEYNTPFNSIDKTEVMWGFPQSSDQTIYYGTPSAFWGASGVGYFNFFVDSTFVNTFTATDIRRTTFLRNGTVVDYKRWRSSKFGLTTTFTDHIPMMRVPEMILIEAESKAELGEADAGDLLYTLQKNRDPNAVKSGATGAALVTEILYERRKELYGEIGVGFLDAKRKQLPIIRGVGHPPTYRVNIPANSNKLTLKLPQTEMDANSSLKASDQNP